MTERRGGSDGLFTREEALGGLSAGRVSTLLFLIESQTARMLARSREDLDPFQTGKGAEDRDLTFLEAFSLGREPPLRPTTQDLELYAPRWAPLAPDNPRLRAELARLLGRKSKVRLGFQWPVSCPLAMIWFFSAAVASSASATRSTRGRRNWYQ